ncbi:hypothetical protein [Sphingopyxis chilensis]
MTSPEERSTSTSETNNLASPYPRWPYLQDRCKCHFSVRQEGLHAVRSIEAPKGIVAKGKHAEAFGGPIQNADEAASSFQQPSFPLHPPSIRRAAWALKKMSANEWLLLEFPR